MAVPAEVAGWLPGRGLNQAQRGDRLCRRISRRLAVAIPAASVDGALVVAFYLVWVFPLSVNAPHRGQWVLVNGIAFGCYLAASLVVGSIWCGRLLQRNLRWLVEDRPPGAAELRRVLRLPLTEAGISGVLWVGAAVLFLVVNLGYSAHWAGDVAVTVLLGGLSNCALDYLLVERLLRPVLAAALAGDGPANPSCLRVTPRMLLGWAFFTAVPVLGIGIGLLTYRHSQLPHLVGPMLFLVAVTLVSGACGTYFATRSVADPLASLRQAMSRVENGDDQVSVAVDDASEVGTLQAGFNRMVAGLRERRRLQDLFGRHVGEEVARRALERGGQLGGDVLDVALFFVDMRGSTNLAVTRRPTEVVTTLNRFFALVVAVVDAHGGWVNKFEGDGALCVFGAPLAHPDPAGAALRAARELHRRLAAVGIDAGLGVAAGPVVAGNVGAESRYEYTVIGDPVNEASRLTELAKTRPGRVLASAGTLQRADEPERRRWRTGDAAALRGRRDPTVLAYPAEAVPAGVG